MFYKKNLVIIGLLLLVIFTVAVWLVGIGIDHTARQMHKAMLEDVGRYRADLITLDFRRTLELSGSLREYLEDHGDNEKGLQNLLLGMVRMDAKVSRIWYRNREQQYTVIDSAGVIGKDVVLETTLDKLIEEENDQTRSKLYYCDGILYWTYIKKFPDIVLGVDVSLLRLHAYFADMSPRVSSYAYILNSEGILIVHPDETRLGRNFANEDDKRLFEKVLRDNQITYTPGFSTYLLLPVERMYYPVRVGNEKWVIVVNVPEMITQEEMAGFHQYTLIIVVVTVLLFSILLAFSQYRWRKEYDRRRQLEKETLQLNLQQLKNQVNPHFLFNSLNSLNALIGNEPVLAKEFVLNLSKLYRYVLEKRNVSMVSVAEEVIFIRHYYFLQKIRFRDQLNLDIDKKVEYEERTIPLMSLQILIENAIKHNEITRQHPLNIRIYPDNHCLVVENSYCPRVDSVEDSLGFGLESIRKIYTFCSDKQFTFGIENDKFVCRLPLI